MSKVEKYIGEAKISEQPTKKLTWMINDNVVATNHIKDNAITEPKISGEDSPNGPAVTTSKIADKAVTTPKIADGAVTEDKLSGGLIDGVITQPAVTTAKIDDGAVTSAKIFSGAVTGDKIASDAVHTENLGIGAVQSIHIAKDAVITEKIFPFAVSEDKIKNYNVTTDKISGSVDPVTGEWTTPPAVTENKIAAGAVTEHKIHDGAVTNEKLATGAVIAGNIAAGAVQNGNLANGCVTTEKLSGGIINGVETQPAVTTDKIQDYDPESEVPTGVTTQKIADGAVTTAKLSGVDSEAGAAVTEDKLAPGAVTTDKLADGLISEIANITDTVPTAGSVKPVQSGGVLDSIIKDGSAFDLSAYTGDSYASLSAALTAMNALSSAYKKGGMSIKYVQSSDNNYVQARCTANEFTTDVTKWQGVDDKPTVGSHNLVESEGVYISNINADFTIGEKIDNLNILSTTKLVNLISISVENENIHYAAINTERGKYYKIVITPSEWDTPNVIGKTGFGLISSQAEYYYYQGITESCHVTLDDSLIIYSVSNNLSFVYRAVIGTELKILVYECEALLNEKRLLGNVLEPISVMWGSYSSDGTFTSIEETATTTSFLKKYQIDPSKEYSANIRVGATGDQAGATYFDANDNWISSEYLNTNGAKIYNNVPLQVPLNASYVVLLGSTGNLSTEFLYPAILFEKGEIVNDVDRIGLEVNDIKLEVNDIKFADNDITELINSFQKKELAIGYSSKKWVNYGGQKHIAFNRSLFENSIAITPKSGYNNVIAFLKSYSTPVIGEQPEFSEGSFMTIFNEKTVFNIPSDCNYIVLTVDWTDSSLSTYLPIDYPKSVITQKIFDSDEVVKNEQYFIDDDIASKLHDLDERNLGIGYLSSNWTDYGNKKHVILPINGSSKIEIHPSSAGHIVLGFLSSYSVPIIGTTPDYAPGTDCIVVESNSLLQIPRGTKYIAINIYDEFDYPDDHYCYPDYFRLIGYIPASYHQTEKYPAVPNTLYYQTVDINPTLLGTNWNAESNQDNAQLIKSGFGYKLPTSYSSDGTPTKVCCCFHGYSGYVTKNVLGYDNWANWNTMQDKLLEAGFLILDINGYGEYSSSNHNSDHWGCQQAVETVKKAFEFLCLNYNVYPTMHIYGYSMGGVISYSYSMNYPQDVDLVALHEPSVGYGHVVPSGGPNIYGSLANRFGYSTWADAEADNFNNFIGYNLPLSFERFDSGVFNPVGVIGLNICTTLPTGTTLRGYFPKPLRIWQGSVGDQVPQLLNENVIKALRNGGCNASIRIGVNLSHSALVGTAYIQDETISYLKRGNIGQQ